jgi:hypothetical protein
MASLVHIPRIRALHNIQHLNLGVWDSILAQDAFAGVTDISGTINAIYSYSLQDRTIPLIPILAKRLPVIRRLTLCLQGSGFSETLFDDLPRLEHLSSLHICMVNSMAISPALATCAAFTSLHLKESFAARIPLETIIPDACAARLDSLKISCMHSIIQWGTRLRTLTSVRSLAIDGFTDSFLHEIIQSDALPALEELSIEPIVYRNDSFETVIRPSVNQLPLLLLGRPRLHVTLRIGDPEMHARYDDMCGAFPHRITRIICAPCCRYAIGY